VPFIHKFLKILLWLKIKKTQESGYNKFKIVYLVLEERKKFMEYILS